ncbi:MAG TPA: flagellar basal-body MS-ring/collar protein FliF [Solirubrobacteraceae bacterium]|nr:flagellar basal-body MS-ring/collar protein FliF [Solirubrobacteraceae bacterium]
MPSFADTIMKLPTRSKVVLGAGALVVVLVLFFMLQLASAPSYTTLVSALDPADTGKVTTALDDQGIAYELRANGTSVAVEKAQVSQARIALASAGVAASGGAHEGYELFDKQKLGASDLQQKVTLQRALEGEIAQTVEQVDGVSGAKVQLVLPEESLFADEATPATAAVMLTGASDALEPGAVRGISQLVASSVKGLKTDNVTITDGAGQLLWPQGDDAGGGGAAGSGKQAAQTRYERQLQASLDALLTQTLGPGKGRVQVRADLNVDKTTREELTVTGKAVPQKQVKETEKLRGGGATAGGTAGTGGNIPTYSGGAAGGNANSRYDRSSTTVDNVVPKTIEKTDVAPGAVNKLQMALVVDKSVPPADFAAIQTAVKGASGFDAKRGDVFEAAQVAFAKPPAEPKAGPVPVGMLGPLKWVGLGLATLLFMFFMARSLRKREGEALASPSWLTEIEQPVSLAELEAPRNPRPEHPTLVLPPREQDQAAQALEQLMDREPDRVAAQVRQWMADD